MAMTMVLPEPVAILEQRRGKLPPSPGMSMPTRSDAGASVSQIRVSMASSWQKKRRWFSRCSGSRPVFEETFGYASYAGIVGFAPGVNAGADFVYEWELDKDARVVEGFRGFGGTDKAPRGGGPVRD